MTERIITWQELQKHIYSYDCWVLIRGYVYKVSDFLFEHPGGNKILIKNSGIDATAAFEGLPHSEQAISLRNSKRMGKIQSPIPPQGYLERIERKKKADAKKQKRKLFVRKQKIPPQEVALHKTQQNCWIILEGKVYDCSDYLEEHPGGVSKIMQWAGKDATKAFKEVNHSMSALKKRDNLYVGDLQSENGLIYLAILLVILAVGAFVFFK